MYLEIIAYYAIVGTICLLLGFELLKQLRGGYRYSIYVLPIVLLSLVSAGSRGMELGTYFGILITILFLLKLNSSRLSATPLILFPAVLVFGSSGGYALPTLATLLLLYIVLYKLVSRESFILRNLRFAFISLFLWVTIYAVLFVKHGGLNESGSSSIVSLLKRDPFYFLRFLFYSQSASLISTQTLEGKGNPDQLLNWISFFLCLFTLISLFRLKRGYVQQLFVPLSLLVYSFSVELLIMITRPTGDKGFLATWYGLHAKLGLIGVVWIWIIMFQNVNQSVEIGNATQFVRKVCIVFPLFLVVFISVSADMKQIHREPFERKYFQVVQEALLFPEVISVDSAGLTPLLLPIDQSKQIISQMKEDHLNVYTRNSLIPTGVPRENQLFKKSGDYYADGWLGLNSQILLNNSSCSNLSLIFDAYPHSLPNTMVIDINHILFFTHIFKTANYAVTLHSLKSGDLVSLRFSKAISPHTIGQGLDQRSLSALLNMQCGAKN